MKMIEVFNRLIIDQLFMDIKFVNLINFSTILKHKLLDKIKKKNYYIY